MPLYIVIIYCWIASASDDRICVYLEKASDPEAAKSQARDRLDYPEQVYSIEAKLVDELNIGLVFMED